MYFLLFVKDISQSIKISFAKINPHEIYWNSLIFDQNLQPWIKNYERSTGGNKEANHDFKEALVRFFVSYWSDKDVGPLQSKILYVNFVQLNFLLTEMETSKKNKLISLIAPLTRKQMQRSFIYNILKGNKCTITWSDTAITVILLSIMYYLKIK